MDKKLPEKMVPNPVRNNGRQGPVSNGTGKFPHPIKADDRKERSVSNGTGKFPLRGRAGYLARLELAKTAKTVVPKTKQETGWGNVAGWYDATVEDSTSYQSTLILPNVLRLLDIKKGETILDLACGQGLFARRYAKSGAKVIGVDIAKELIAIAQPQSPDIQYYVSGADELSFIPATSVDKITIVLALQNIENMNGVFKECARVLKPKGKLIIVLNHPAFRIPKQSQWGWEGGAHRESLIANRSEGMIQFRRIDKYMSETREKIAMHPGQMPNEQTVSFHRPMQSYVKALGKSGLAITNMQEWVSDRKSQPGPRAAAEDKARAEIPLFMALEIVKL